MTVEEAGRKTCPVMTYCYNPRQVSTDGEAAIYVNGPCEGPACMWWGWQCVLDETKGIGHHEITELGRCEAPGGAK